MRPIFRDEFYCLRIIAGNNLKCRKLSGGLGLRQGTTGQRDGSRAGVPQIQRKAPTQAQHGLGGHFSQTEGTFVSNVAALFPDVCQCVSRGQCWTHENTWRPGLLFPSLQRKEPLRPFWGPLGAHLFFLFGWWWPWPSLEYRVPKLTTTTVCVEIHTDPPPSREPGSYIALILGTFFEGY